MCLLLELPYSLSSLKTHNFTSFADLYRKIIANHICGPNVVIQWLVHITFAFMPCGGGSKTEHFEVLLLHYTMLLSGRFKPDPFPFLLLADLQRPFLGVLVTVQPTPIATAMPNAKKVDRDKLACLKVNLIQLWCGPPSV